MKNKPGRTAGVAFVIGADITNDKTKTNTHMKKNKPGRTSRGTNNLRDEMISG